MFQKAKKIWVPVHQVLGPAGRVDTPVNTLGGELGVDGSKAQIVLASRMLRPRKFYEVGTIIHKHDDLQLIMELPLILPNNETIRIKALIDTGAEANLIRMGLAPSHLLRQAKYPMKLIAANGQRLGGGERVLAAILGFEAQKNGIWQDELMEFGASFFEAEINVDAIISFSWMAQHKIGVFPHKRALAIDHPELIMLYGLSDKKKEYTPKKKDGEDWAEC